jgi:hypothetical protein
MLVSDETSAGHRGVPLGEGLRDPAVAALLEDFRSRWQELLNFESEVSRWFTLYVTAVIAVIGWFMGNTSFEGDVQRLLKGHDGLNSLLVLALALLNAVYVLALAFNGYRIQQIGQYLYGHVGVRVTELTKERFNVWEEWRRHSQDDPRVYGPERIRKVYFIAVGAIPILVSILLIGIYWWFEGWTQSLLSGHNLFSYIVVLTTAANAYVSYSTTAQNAQWQTLIDERFAKEHALRIKRTGGDATEPADDEEAAASAKGRTEASAGTLDPD